jgi:hypothetical protein
MADQDADKTAAEKAAQDKAIADAAARAADLQKELERVTKKLQAKLDAEEEAKRAALAEQGKFKEAYEVSEAKYKADLDPLKAELAKYRAQEETHRKALIAKLPEDKREKYSVVPVEVLEDMVETLKTKQPTAPAKPGDTTEEKKFDQLSPEEQMDLKKSNPVLYDQKYREYYKRRTGKDPSFSVI